MLPFGWISEAGEDGGPDHWANLTLDEQRTQMTLWSMAKRSSLMIGAVFGPCFVLRGARGELHGIRGAFVRHVVPRAR